MMVDGKYADAVTESGRNPVKHHIQLEFGE